MKIKKSIYLLLQILFLSMYSAYGQENTILKFMQNLKPEHIPYYVDSLKSVIIQDTIKFNRGDLVVGTYNVKDYSKLYIINGQYFYKLDIIPGKKVIEFVNEYLLPDKISGISIINDTRHSQAIYGRHAISGVVIIHLKKRVKFNPRVAGLKLNDKRRGDNFDQQQSNKLFIRDKKSLGIM